MRATRTPAALSSALFVVGLVIGSRLVEPPIGHAVVGCALGFALWRPWSLAFAAFAAGIVLFSVQSGEALSSVDRSRVVELVGRVAGSWIDEAEGYRGRIDVDLVRSGNFITLVSEPVTVQLDGDIEPPPPGGKIRVRGHLQRSAGFANARAVPPGAWRIRIKSDRFLELVEPAGPLDRMAQWLRQALVRPFDRHAERHVGVAYARGLLFGDLRAVGERDQRAFRRAGLAHLMAVSGMNVALAVAFLATAGVYFARGPRLALALVAVTAHLAVVGSAPSLLRASAMAFWALAALALRRPPLPLQLLLLSGVGLLVASPRLLFDLGFQLSCAATIGLVALTPRLVERFGRGPRWLRIGLATSVAAQVATLPLVASQFASVSPGAIVLNLLYVPLASALLVSSFAWATLGIAVPGLAGVAALPLDLLARPFTWLAYLPSGPWLSLPTAGTITSGLLAFAGASAILLAPLRLRQVALLCGLGLLSAGAPVQRTVELVMADVGQGEGILVRGAGVALLVDGGGVRGRDLAAQVWLPILAERGIGSLHAMVVSHGDIDHCGGLIDVAVHLPVREVWGAPGFVESPCVRELLFWSRARWRALGAGDRAVAGGLRFDVLWPPAGEAEPAGNASSLVVRLEAEGRTVLLTGDLDGEAERRFVGRAGDRLAVDVLKVGHHGSARGTGADLLRWTRPRLALVSAGPANRFGHPSPAVTERLARHGATTLSTERVGMIALSWARGAPIRIDLPGVPRAAG